MPQQITCPFTITRTSSFPIAFDAAGHVADAESVDIDITGTVSGSYMAAEPDCGCAAGFEGLAFVARDALGFAIDYDLDGDEAERATTKLLGAMNDGFDD